MTLNELRKMIEAGDLPGLFLLHGQESYFIDEAVRLITDHVVPPDGRDFNLTKFYGRDFRPVELIEQAMTLPAFAPHRLVLLKDLHEASADQLEGLLSYLDNPVPETVLLMTAEKIDARRKFFQRLRKVGQVCEFKKIYDNQLPGFIRDLARDEGYSFTGGALKLFCKRVGSNLTEARGELEKLISYLGDRDLIDESDVASVVSDTRAESVFALTDALGTGNCAEALRLLSRLIDDGQAPLMILAMMSRHFRQLWKASELLAQRTPQKDLPRRIGVSPYFLKGLLNQAAQYDNTDYRFVFHAFLDVDLALKSSGGEPKAHLERLVMSISDRCGQKRKGVA